MPGSTPTFTAEAPLVTSPHDERELDIRFRAGQNLLNACRDDALKRFNKMKRSAEWKAAKAMPKRTEKQKQARWAAFDAVRTSPRGQCNATPSRPRTTAELKSI